jgi:proteasome assembly chaperone (PAC2) family protein
VKKLKVGKLAAEHIIQWITQLNITKMKSIGIDDEILENCAYRIEGICAQLKEICYG